VCVRVVRVLKRYLQVRCCFEALRCIPQCRLITHLAGCPSLQHALCPALSKTTTAGCMLPASCPPFFRPSVPLSICCRPCLQRAPSLWAGHADTCNTPTASMAVVLLCDALTPQCPGSTAGSSGSSGALLPAAALGRLAAAAVAVLPSVAADEAAAVGTGVPELQPTPEGQQSIEHACRCAAD
jgi:hypothetical protein